LTCIKFGGNVARIMSRMPTPRIRTLRRALQTLGGEEPLARALGVSLAQLAEWLAGAACPHDAAYFVALDIVARSHFRERRIKNTTSSARAAKVTA
jgi:DNA-binding transcriptional regulator YiaG